MAQAMNQNLLDRRLASALRQAIGDRLIAVTYRCLDGEADQLAIKDADFFMGGELRLEFASSTLFVSWEEKVGWYEHFSIGVRAASFLVTDAAVEEFDGRDHPLWRPLIGLPLLAVEVHGREGTPYVVVLRFPVGSIVVASASRTEIGDGDDLVVRSEEVLVADSSMEMLWRHTFAAEPDVEPDSR